MIDPRRSRLCLATLTIAVLCVVAAAGCNKPQEENAGGPGPPGAQGPGGGPGGMGGPGGRMGGGAPVAASATGSEIYQQKCQGCHGGQGQGGRGPALTGLASRSDADLHKIVHDGKGRSMPAFGTQLTDAQIDKVIEQIKTLGAAKGSGSG